MVNVYDCIQNYRTIDEKTRNELTNAKENLLLTTEQVERLTNENDSIKRQLKSLKDQCGSVEREYSEREQRLSDRLRDSEEKYLQYKAKGES